MGMFDRARRRALTRLCVGAGLLMGTAVQVCAKDLDGAQNDDVPLLVDSLADRFGSFDPIGVNSFALGQFATAEGEGATAIGYTANAAGDNSTAIGAFSTALGANSIAFGVQSMASGANTIAFGNQSVASGSSSLALGVQSTASGANAAAFGNHSLSSGDNSVAVGVQSQATAANTTALGNHSLATGDNSTAIGVLSQASGDNSQAIGNHSRASGDNSTAVGELSRAVGLNTTAIGNLSKARGDNSVAVGILSLANGENATAIGNQSIANGANSAAIGVLSVASGENSVAIGNQAVASGDNSIAIGSGSIATAANVVSFGAPGEERRLVNIAPGIDDSDAATMGQLHQTENKLGSQIKQVRKSMKAERKAFHDKSVALREKMKDARKPKGPASTPLVRNASARPATSPAATVKSVNVAAARGQPSAARRRANAPQPEDSNTTADTSDSGQSSRATNRASRQNATTNAIASLSNDITARFADVDHRIDRNTSGVAMAMALSGGSLPSDKKMSVAINYGTFGGMSAVALSGNLRVDDHAVVSGGLSYGIDENQVGGRVGMQFAW